VKKVIFNISLKTRYICQCTSTPLFDALLPQHASGRNSTWIPSDPVRIEWVAISSGV